MKNPEDMTNLQILKWLDKTYKSISNRPVSCLPSSMRGETLVDRYEELRDQALVRDDLWSTWCNYSGSDYNHDAYDLFA